MNTSKRASAHASYTNWNSVNWNEIQKYVTKLRQRIYRAEQLKQQRKVRKLQRLLLRSEANLLLSIRKVTQQNKRKRTSGVDGYTALLAGRRNELYRQLKQQNIFQHRLKSYYQRLRTILEACGIEEVFWCDSKLRIP